METQNQPAENQPKTLLEKYKAPTPWKFRRIGDFALYMTPVTIMGILQFPDDMVSPHAKIWMIFFNVLFGHGVKFWTDTMHGPVPSKEDTPVQ